MARLARSRLGAILDRFRVVHPLAVRSLRLRWAGSCLIALTVALSVTVFVLFSASSAGSRQAVAGRVRPLDLPGDLIIRSTAPIDGAILSAISGQADVRAARSTVVARLMTAAGETEVLGLTPDLLAPGRVILSAGRVPAADGEIVIPTDMAERAGLKLGAPFILRRLVGGRLVEARAVIVGFGRSRYGYFADRPLMTIGALKAAFSLEPNVVIVEADDPVNVVRIERFLNNLRLSRPAAAGLRVVTARTPVIEAGSLVRGVFSSGRLAVFLVFVFAAIGVLDVLLLSFLQRKRPLGVLKALGFEDDDLVIYLSLEAGLMGLAGLLAGLTMAGVSVWILNRRTPTSLAISAWPIAGAAFLSLTIILVASWLPITLTRRAPVNALLQNRRVYLDPTSACAQCGRCGGF